MSKHTCSHTYFTAGCTHCESKLTALHQHVNQASDGGIVNTGVMGNMQSSHGMQINVGNVNAGRSVMIGGSVVGGAIVTDDSIIVGDVGMPGVAIGRGARAEVYSARHVFRGTCEYCRVPYELHRKDGEPAGKCGGCGAPLPI